MTGLSAALWALLGGAVAESLNLSYAMRPLGPHDHWHWPWASAKDRPMVLVAIALRLFAGCGLAAPLGASSQLPTPFAAFIAGLATPLIVARIFGAIQVAQPDQSHAGAELSLSSAALVPGNINNPVAEGLGNAAHRDAGGSDAAR